MRIMLALSLLAASLVTAAPKVPRKAAEFAIQMPDGQQTLLSSYRGKTVVMAFMFTTCPHCKKTARFLTQVQKEYADKGVQVLGATFDPAASYGVKDFNREQGVNFPCGFSTKEAVLTFLQAEEPFFVPILVFIDKTGTVRSEYIGDEKFLSNQEVNIRAEIDGLLKSAPVGGKSLSGKSVVKKSPKS